MEEKVRMNAKSNLLNQSGILLSNRVEKCFFDCCCKRPFSIAIGSCLEKVFGNGVLRQAGSRDSLCITKISIRISRRVI